MVSCTFLHCVHSHRARSQRPSAMSPFSDNSRHGTTGTEPLIGRDTSPRTQKEPPCVSAAHGKAEGSSLSKSRSHSGTQEQLSCVSWCLYWCNVLLPPRSLYEHGFVRVLVTQRVHNRPKYRGQ